jgi:TonB family protein
MNQFYKWRCSAILVSTVFVLGISHTSAQKTQNPKPDPFKLEVVNEAPKRCFEDRSTPLTLGAPGSADGTAEKPVTPKEVPCAPESPITPLKVLEKPRAPYTDAAKANNVTGTVRLRVTFHQSGKVTDVVSISGLSYGLTASAIAAAKRIRFEPEKKNGVPVTIVKLVEYKFDLY